LWLLVVAVVVVMQVVVAEEQVVLELALGYLYQEVCQLPLVVVEVLEQQDLGLGDLVGHHQYFLL
jgi:hypothetical protein